MPTLDRYDRAQDLIRAAGDRFDRGVVLGWAAIRDEAQDPRERQAIASLSEAFYPLARSEEDQRWLGMFLSGIPQAVEEARATAELTGAGRRTDAAKEPEQQKAPAEGQGIDWENVASEVKTMLRLNPDTGWKEEAEEEG